MPKKVYIIVLNWNGKEDTLESLSSLEKTNYENYQTVLVDNNSEDGSVEAVKEKFPQVKIIENSENLGFAGGNNVGIEYAVKEKADYIFLINNDTTVDPNYLKELVDTADSDSKIGLVGSKIYYHTHPDTIWFAGGKINWLRNKGEHVGLNEKDKPEYNQRKETGYLTGCALLIRREVIENIGLLEEDYFLYYEDTDFCLRTKKAGYKVVYEPKSIIYHKVSRSTKPNSPSYIYYHIRNGLVNARRNGNFLVKFSIYIFAIWLFIKQIIKLFIPSKRTWAIAVLKGEKDFLLNRMGKV